MVYSVFRLLYEKISLYPKEYLHNPQRFTRWSNDSFAYFYIKEPEFPFHSQFDTVLSYLLTSHAYFSRDYLTYSKSFDFEAFVFPLGSVSFV